LSIKIGPIFVFLLRLSAASSLRRGHTAPARPGPAPFAYVTRPFGPARPLPARPGPYSPNGEFGHVQSPHFKLARFLRWAYYGNQTYFRILRRELTESSVVYEQKPTYTLPSFRVGGYC
jgi:hypothetical protein